MFDLTRRSRGWIWGCRQLSAQCIRSAPDLLFVSASLRCRRRRSSRTSLRPFVGVPSRERSRHWVVSFPPARDRSGARSIYLDKFVLINSDNAVSAPIGAVRRHAGRMVQEYWGGGLLGYAVGRALRHRLVRGRSMAISVCRGGTACVCSAAAQEWRAGRPDERAACRRRLPIAPGIFVLIRVLASCLEAAPARRRWPLERARDSSQARGRLEAPQMAQTALRDCVPAGTARGRALRCCPAARITTGGRDHSACSLGSSS